MTGEKHMSIIYQKEKRVFTLRTGHSVYQMQVGRYGVLLHLYYGKSLNGEVDYLTELPEVSFSGNPYEAGMDRNFSLDTLPQEFPSYGVGDFRTPCAAIEEADGSHAVDFRYVSHQIKEGAYETPGMPCLYDEDQPSETLEIILEDQVSHVRLILYYGVFAEQDMITRSAKIVNIGNSSIALERMLSACLDFPYGEWEMVHFEGRHVMERKMERVPLPHGITSIGSRRGASSHQHNPGFILCEPQASEDHGSCYGIMLVYSGNFLAEVEVDQIGQTRAVIGIHPDNFHFKLEAGEEFYTPQALLTYTDQGFGKLSHNFHHIIRHNICRGKYKFARRPVLINNWEATYFDFNEEKLFKIAKQASSLGIEMLVMDDGWFGKRNDDYSGLGDWKVNLTKLKGGLAPLVEKINSLGMKFGIWFEPEMVSEDSDLYRSHPDWALQIPGRKPNRSRYQLVLDLSRKDVRDYLFESISDVLNSANIEYIKWDYNRSMCDVYSALLPKERQGEVCHRYILGLYELLERLLKAFPDLLLEGCSGGGGRFDAAMLYYSPQIWCSDDTDAVERLEIQYGTSFMYPISAVGSHVSACPNHQTGRITPLSTRGVVAMAGSFGYELDLNLLTEEEKIQVKAQVAEFKKYDPLIHNGTYYRLTSPYDHSIVTAWQFVSEDQTEALVNAVAVRMSGGWNRAHIKLKGLDPDRDYRNEKTGEVYSGSALMYGGLVLTLPRMDYSSIQIYFKKVD